MSDPSSGALGADPSGDVDRPRHDGPRHGAPDRGIDGVQAHRAVLTVTHELADAAQPAAHAYATDLARRCGVPLVFYDRSEETWTDYPHPEGPLRADHEHVQGRPHLVAQLQAATDAGVEALAWLSTLPSISSITTAVADTGADVIVVSAATKGRMVDWMSPGGGFAERIANQFVDDPSVSPLVVEVDGEGNADVVDTVRR